MIDQLVRNKILFSPPRMVRHVSYILYNVSWNYRFSTVLYTALPTGTEVAYIKLCASLVLRQKCHAVEKPELQLILYFMYTQNIKNKNTEFFHLALFFYHASASRVRKVSKLHAYHHRLLMLYFGLCGGRNPG
jgi:hypothetical protein